MDGSEFPSQAWENTEPKLLPIAMPCCAVSRLSREPEMGLCPAWLLVCCVMLHWSLPLSELVEQGSGCLCTRLAVLLAYRGSGVYRPRRLPVRGFRTPHTRLSRRSFPAGCLSLGHGLYPVNRAHLHLFSQLTSQQHLKTDRAVPISPFFIDGETEALSRSQWQSEDLNWSWSAGSQASPFHHAPVPSGPQAQGHRKGSTTPLASPSN